MMTIFLVLLLICGFVLLGLFAFVFLAGASETTSAFDQAIDDMEQERAIREWLEERERKKKNRPM